MEAFGAVLIALGVGSVITAVVNFLLNRRKFNADTASVLSKTAVDLIEPLRREIKRVRDECALEEARLRGRIDGLSEDLQWMRRERADQIRRDRARELFDRAMVAWVGEWLSRARALGLEVPDPPDPPDLAPLLAPDWLNDAT